MTISKMIEATFPPKTRLNFTETDLVVSLRRETQRREKSTISFIPTDKKAGCTEPSDVVFVPMSLYMKAIDTLDFAESAIRAFEAGFTESAIRTVEADFVKSVNRTVEADSESTE